MRIKALELQGFKSFADRTVLDFQNGITAVVGPNGSGKSNIADAMRWVMGEQSAKSLRGGNMQDVIFAGTQKRKALGYAEVSLIIDNSDKQLPIDFEEVIVTRRLFRSGESEYFINKSSVRLKDIHELFWDTGVGREGYSIIGQGKIAEIINTKSDDRRGMFEEAAGITKFRHRKEEAERKLAYSNDQILRVNDIITEIEGQIGPLKEQSEKAKIYLNLRDKLKTLEVNLALKNISKIRAFVDEVDGKLSIVKSQLDGVNSKIEANEKHTEDIFNAINAAEEFSEQTREKQKQMEEELSQFKTDINVLKSRIDGNNDNIKRIQLEISELNIKFDEVEKSISDEMLVYNEFKAKRAAISEELANFETDLLNFDKNAANDNKEIDSINAEIIEKLNKIADLRADISNFSALIQSYDERTGVIRKELTDRADDFDRLNKNKEALENKFNDKTKSNDELNEKLGIQNAELSKYSNELASLEEELQTKKLEYQQSVSRQKLLRDMEKSFDNYSKSVKTVMNEHDGGSLSSLKLYGTVASLVSVDKKYTTAIEVALGAAAQNIVTETEEDAKKAIEFLKRTKQGRATFLPISEAKDSEFRENGVEKCAGYIGIAADVINYDGKYDSVIKSLLGRVVVVDNIDNAVSMARKYSYKFRIVTLTGEMLAPGGSMSGGSRANTSGLFARANEIVELDKIISKSEIVIKELEIKRNKAFDSVETTRNSLESTKAQINEVGTDLIKIKAELDNSAAFIESVTMAKKSMEDELEQLSSYEADLQKKIELAKAEIDSVNSSIAAMEKDAASKKEHLENNHSLREKILEGLSSKRLELNSVEKDMESLNERISAANIRKQELTLNIDQKNANIKEMEDAIETLNDDIEFKNEQIESITEDISSLKEAVDNSEASRKEAQESIKTQQEENKTLHDEQIKLQQEYSRIESQKSKNDMELENIIDKLWEDYELTPASAEDLRADIPGDAPKQVNEIKGKIRELGNINIGAIEEYQQVSERYEQLTTKRDDIVKGIQDLEKIISDMLIIMKEQFSDKFKIINRHFGETFVQLFGGGKAELALTDPDDVLNSGVEINVQPPGKALKSMLQLSGGEQAFVSIALLFAILKVRPSPFCVLDEIEAALDDVNVYRFADYLKKFSKNSQFIVVTHRRGTMEAANILYGITMQEQGVSRLLSLNIDDVVKMDLA